MKKSLLLLGSVALLTLTACGSGGVPAGKHEIVFWGWGDETEIDVYKAIVKKYNETNKDGNFVTYYPKPAADYVTTMERTLGTTRAPDIFYVGDGDLKRWVKYDFLEDITDKVANSEIIDTSDIWSTALERYRYNVSTKTSEETDPLYCLPKDIGPTVIYYNVDAFKAVGINIISKPESECSEAEKHGFNLEAMTFNNRISMTVDEELALSKLLTKSINPDSITKYGFYTEWWFNYVWSIGGDCLGKNEEGDYIWTLGDTTPHGDLPSNRELFEHFINLSVKEKVMPNPSEVSSAKKVSSFYTKKFAMLVGLRAHVPTFRKMCKFEWDVAPLSHEEGGVLAGHSGSMGFGIAKKISQERKDRAFQFMEYLAGPEGQAATAESGFNLPNQISIAKTDVFLQKDQMPHNSVAFVEAAEYQHKGDWAYLPDKLWIDDWAADLNGPVLDGTMTVNQFFAKHQEATDLKLKHYS